MKLTAVFAAILSLAVAWQPDLRLMGMTDVPHVHYVPMAAGSEHSPIPVKVAHSLIRTYGFNQPSDADMDDFAEDVDYSDEDAPYNLRSLYTSPVLIFLEDGGDKVIAYYADRGINMIKGYPETFSTLNKLLDNSNAVVLSYKPEMFLYPADRNAVSSRFFTPKNYRIALSYARAPENYRGTDTPLVFRKYEIPPSYSPIRTQFAEYDIDKMPYAYRYPVTLKTTDIPEYSLWKERIPFATDADYAFSKFPVRYNHMDAYVMKHYCAKYPSACSRLVKFDTQSDVTPVTVPKMYAYVSPIDTAKVVTLKPEIENIKKPLDAGSAFNLCAKNPLACGMHLKTAPWMKSPTVPFRPLAHMRYNIDPLYDDKINNLYDKQIIPKIAYKFNSPVVSSDDYLDDYYPTTIPSADLTHGGVLKTLLKSY